MNKRIFIALLLFLQCTLMMAQRYCYSVTTGTSWSREAYPRYERQVREAMKNGQLIDGAPNFCKIFNEIIYNYNHSNYYNDSIFAPLPHEEWINMFKRRATKFSQFYIEDNQAIGQLESYFSSGNVPAAAYDSLFFWTQNMYHRNINDIFLYEKLLDILQPYYERKQDIEHLIFCYMCSGLYNYQCARMGDKESSLRSETFYHKIINLGDNFSKFKDPINHYYFISAYANLAILHTQAGNISLSESVELTNNVRKLFAKPEAKEIFAKDSILSAYADWAFDVFRLRGIATFISHKLSNPWLRTELYDAYKAFKDEHNNNFTNLKNRYYAKLQYDDLLIEAYMGHISWDEAYKRLDKELKADKELHPQRGKVPSIKINYLNNVAETTISIVENTSMSKEQKGAIIKDLLEKVLKLISQYEHSRYPFEKGMILANMTSKEEILQYLDSKERRELLFRLIVLEQPTTFVHVSMVAELAKELASHVVDKMPEFFVGMPNLTSPDKVQQKKDSLVDYIFQAAIYHDLGKISMPTVVNNCIRRLTDHEYSILSLHPEKSRPFFAIDPSLYSYQDIALGHHKWYDGDGYPYNFKNRRSPYFPAICLVTICDCLDAATENIGRNYHQPKPFDEVLEEFVAEAGSRYHPDIISFIQNNKDVQEAMRQIVDVGRYDHYYKMYKTYMVE